MSQNSETMLAVLLVVGLVVGAGIGYFMAPNPEQEIVEVTVVEYVETLGNYPVQPKYIKDIPSDLSTVEMYRFSYRSDEYLIFVWYGDNDVYWSYSKIGG